MFDSLRTVSERILPTYPPWKRGRAMKCRSTLITFAPSTISTWRVLAGMGGKVSGGQQAQRCRAGNGTLHPAQDLHGQTAGKCSVRRMRKTDNFIDPFFFLPLAAAERQKPALTTTTTAGRPSVCPFGAPPLLSPFYPSPCPSSLHLCLSAPKAFTSLLRPGNCR